MQSAETSLTIIRALDMNYWRARCYENSMPRSRRGGRKRTEMDLASHLLYYSRTLRELPKAHWIDAACVGRSTPLVLSCQQVKPLFIKATGHGIRQRCLPDRYGFPRTSAKGARQVKGFQTGDIVKAIVPTGKKVGTYVGRVAVRSSGSFNITTHTRTIQGISSRHCRMLQRSDGYAYSERSGGASSPCLQGQGSPRRRIGR